MYYQLLTIFTIYSVSIIIHSLSLLFIIMNTTDLSEKHVLRVVLPLCDLVAKFFDLGVLRCVGVDLVAQLLVLVEQALSISQTVGDVL